MRVRKTQSSDILTAVNLLIVCFPWHSSAHPYPADDLHNNGFGYLMARQCVQYCGWNNQYCCSSGTACHTSNGIAGCSAAGGGGVAWYTTTWTETETFTRTYSSVWPAQTGVSGQACKPDTSRGETACGHICCANWQYCAWQGQCAAGGGLGEGGAGPGPGAGIVTMTMQYSAPYRVTGTPSVTATGAAGGSDNAGVSPGGTSDRLSGGAIAGIVIGTLLGVILLLAICVCCIMRGLWHGVLAVFGLGPKKKRSREAIIEEDRYARRGSMHSRRDNHGSWYGGRQGSAARRNEKSAGGMLGLAGAFGTLMLLLGLRRDKKRRETVARAAARRGPRSDVSSTYFTDSYTADSPSSLSSDRRTRRSRRSRASRASRATRATRTTRVSRVSSARGPSARPPSVRSPKA